MKVKIEFVDGSVKVVKVGHITVDLDPLFNNLYYQCNNFKRDQSYSIDEISRVIVDGEIIYDCMGRKENYNGKDTLDKYYKGKKVI